MQAHSSWLPKMHKSPLSWSPVKLHAVSQHIHVAIVADVKLEVSHLFCVIQQQIRHLESRLEDHRGAAKALCCTSIQNIWVLSSCLILFASLRQIWPLHALAVSLCSTLSCSREMQNCHRLQAAYSKLLIWPKDCKARVKSSSLAKWKHDNCPEQEVEVQWMPPCLMHGWALWMASWRDADAGAPDVWFWPAGPVFQSASYCIKKSPQLRGKRATHAQKQTERKWWSWTKLN